MPKTIVYIDGQNFMHRAEEKLARAGLISGSEKLERLDVKYIFKSLLSDEDTEIRYYGVTKVKRETKFGDEVLAKSIQISDSIRRLKGYLLQNGIRYRSVGRLHLRGGDSGYKYTEKGVDVGLAIELFNDAVSGKVDKIVLVSSDVDLIPAIRAASKYVDVVYIGFEGILTKDLIRLTSETKIISNELLGLAFARTMVKSVDREK